MQLSIQCRGGHFCGGSLLNPWTAITAAHCCDKITEGKGTSNSCQHKDVTVVAGEHSLSKRDGTEQVNSYSCDQNSSYIQLSNKPYVIKIILREHNQP